MSKINKLGKSTFVVAILSFLLVAVLAFGGTYAYFSATAGATQADEFTVGTLTLDLKKGAASVEAMENFEIVQPGQYLIGSADAKVTYTLDLAGTNINAYVRMKVSATLASGAYTGNTGADSSIDTDAEFFTILTSNGWFLHEDGWLYQSTAADAAVTPVASTATDTDNSVTIDVSVQVNTLVGEDGSKHFMGKTGSWIIQAEAIQADYTAIDANSDGTVTVTELAGGWAGVVSTVA